MINGICLTKARNCIACFNNNTQVAMQPVTYIHPSISVPSEVHTLSHLQLTHIIPGVEECKCEVGTVLLRRTMFCVLSRATSMRYRHKVTTDRNPVTRDSLSLSVLHYPLLPFISFVNNDI